MSTGRKDFVPRPDGDFAAWANQFAIACEAERKDIPLTEEQVEEITASVQGFMDAWNANTAAQAAAESARQVKDAARIDTERLLRQYARIFQSLPTMTDALRAEIGITVRQSGAGPSAAPATRPLLSVQIPARLTHTLRLTDEATPTRTARPRGVVAAEVWMKVVDEVPAPAGRGPADAPAAASSLGDPETFSFLSLTTRPTLRADFKPADGGKTAAYMLRWISTRGERGPWSEVCTATIAA